MVDLRSGFSHAVAVLENGDVYIWGRMQGTKVKTDARVPVYEDQLYPRKVDISGGGRAVEAFCSSFNTLLRMDDGRCVRLLVTTAAVIVVCFSVLLPILQSCAYISYIYTAMIFVRFFSSLFFFA